MEQEFCVTTDKNTTSETPDYYTLKNRIVIIDTPN